ncbi:MAG: diaminopimelate decarboxylase [Syntrophomonadaceae bacterium]|nr:diaminopimelate decarboxylase [Syntrophomonadaceae bacterium]
MKLTGTMKVNDSGHLEIGGVDCLHLVREYGTPLYVLDEALFRQNCRQFKQAFEKAGDNLVIYAGKALSTRAICLLVKEEGLGLDVVSGGELYTALSVDFPVENIFFHGNNKTRQELQLAVENRVGTIVVDNFYEMGLLDEICATYNYRQKVLLRISPGIEAHTHEYIKTGQIDSKFGFVLPNGQAMEAVRKLTEYTNLDFQGIHCHIGSQIFEMESFAHTAEIMMSFIARVKDETGLETKELNLGGGFGIYYTEGDEPVSPEAWVDAVIPSVRKNAEKYGLPMPRIIVEPGRAIVGPAGTTLYTVGSSKEIPGVRKYVAVDGGMGDNPRPALYKSKYDSMLANKAKLPDEEVVSIAGKCCESGDMLLWDISLPKVEPGDILAVASTGAYNYTMAMNYNRIPRPAMVLVGEGRSDIIIRRESFEDLVHNDMVPERLKG